MAGHLIGKQEKAGGSYLRLVQQLDSDIDKMIAEGVATKADGLSVKVKVNEAEMKLTQVEDGLSLSKMVLCQLCGIPLNEDIRLADEEVENLLVADEAQPPTMLPLPLPIAKNCEASTWLPKYMHRSQCHPCRVLAHCSPDSQLYGD